MDPAAVRRHREVRAPGRPRSHVDVRQGCVRRAGRRAGHDTGLGWAARPGQVRQGCFMGAAGGPQPHRRPSHDPRRWWDHRIARQVAAAVGLPPDGRAPHREPPRRCRRCAGSPIDTRMPCRAPTSSCWPSVSRRRRRGFIGADELQLMEDHAWLINVARGRHVVTEDLVGVLRDGVIGGAGLDVSTEPAQWPDLSHAPAACLGPRRRAPPCSRDPPDGRLRLLARRLAATRAITTRATIFRRELDSHGSPLVVAPGCASHLLQRHPAAPQAPVRVLAGTHITATSIKL